jgi:AraC family transcriptional regulator
MENLSKLLIKGMVCQRCILVIQLQLEQMELTDFSVDLGEVSMSGSGNFATIQRIQQTLAPLGFQVLEDKKARTVNEIKQLVADVYSGSYDFPYRFRFSEFVISALGRDYDAVSALFSSIEHRTIERYVIEYRIEKIKEFLVYSSFDLSEIAFKLNYSSVAHLSRQFKQYTGLTPSHFKEIKKAKLKLEFSDH